MDMIYFCLHIVFRVTLISKEHINKFYLNSDYICTIEDKLNKGEHRSKNTAPPISTNLTY